MAKATLTLANGTVVQLDGTPEEVHRLLELYSGQSTSASAAAPAPRKQRRPKTRARAVKTASAKAEGAAPGLTEIVNLVKNSDEADLIERNILDRASQVDRVLLPLYIVHEHLGNQFGLTSGEVAKVTTELGVRMTQPNASRTLSDAASRYVMGDKVRRKGQPVRYRLSRRGLQYMKSVLSSDNGE